MSKLDITREAREQRINQLKKELVEQQKLVDECRNSYSVSYEISQQHAKALAFAENCRLAIEQDLISWQGE
jgi:C4-dicarboxylate-specific signal transduction histidine kinase